MMCNKNTYNTKVLYFEIKNFLALIIISYKYHITIIYICKNILHCFSLKRFMKSFNVSFFLSKSFHCLNSPFVQKQTFLHINSSIIHRPSNLLDIVEGLGRNIFPRARH